MFTYDVNQAAKDHAIAEYPKESCGFVVDNVYIPKKNIHPEPEKHFRIDARNYTNLIKAGKKLQAIVHSHPNVTRLEPSYDDQALQIAYDISCGIIQCTMDEVEKKPQASNVLWWGTGVPTAPLVGRPFITGVWDCLQIVIDYYKTELNIDVGNHPRDLKWWDKPKGEPNWNMIEDKVSDFGFERLEFTSTNILKPHDVIFMSILSKTGVANHCAIYTGGDEIIHHLPGINGRESLSKRDTCGQWIPYFKFIGRHKECQQ